MSAGPRLILLSGLALAAPLGAQKSPEQFEFNVDTAQARRAVIVCISSAERAGPPITCVPKDTTSADLNIKVDALQAGWYQLVLFDRHGRLVVTMRFQATRRKSVPRKVAA